MKMPLVKQMKKSQTQIRDGIKKKIIIEYYEYHPLLESAMTHFTNILKTYIDQKKGQSPKLTEAEYYIRDSFQTLNTLSKRQRQVNEAIKFLEKRPQENLLKRYQMSHNDYFDYHFNSLLSYYVSFPECILQTINTILNLGINEKHVKFESMESHDWIVRFDLKKDIKQLKQLRNKLSADRNKAVHQGKPKDIESLLHYFSAEFLAEGNTHEGKIKDIIDDHKLTRRKLFEWKMKETLDPIKNDFNEMDIICDDVLKKLIPIFDLWLNYYKIE
ncbi:hypothetical protein [Bdellovibrio bacteriovorus]|uniref:hypothetical protein n=2 Tax=Bdellovibrio bacteriovorus TaxID=959 RepID=UPI001185D00C